VLIDRSGNPCLTDFGLSTVAGDVELQLTTLTAERSLGPRWRAPEVIGIEGNAERPSFKSDIYSFGGVMFFVRSTVFLQRCLNLLTSDRHRRYTVETKEVTPNYCRVVQKRYPRTS
jgi:serine/threonine protein kinase